jgi:hypothetical protein
LFNAEGLRPQRRVLVLEDACVEAVVILFGGRQVLLIDSHLEGCNR